jgi:hypothetical protein
MPLALLRDALSAGSRCIVFDVAGEIVLRKQIYLRGAFITVDGFSAPDPGITVRDFGISMWGTDNADGALAESDTTNGVARTQVVVSRPLPDLALSAVSIPSQITLGMGSR